jgi:hypothetical protein
MDSQSGRGHTGGRSNGEHEIQGEATFIEREEADKQAFLMGKAWIDRKEAGDISQEEISSS